MRKCWKQIDFSEKDTLYVLGDIVDRGSGSMKVLQDMMRRANVHGLIGNHELMCVSCLDWLSQEITEDAIAKLSEAKLRTAGDGPPKWRRCDDTGVSGPFPQRTKGDHALSAGSCRL
ncbi:MAG: metallophosphoesterase [Merdibacter sp.]